MSNLIGHTGANRRNILFLLPEHPFDYAFLMWLLRDYRSPRDKISRMIKSGEIIQIKKGLYTRPAAYGGKIDKKIIANLIHGPSYVSLDFALQYWGLIPERVEIVTSITCKRKKRFNTPLGYFSYKYLNQKKFYPGILWEKLEISDHVANKNILTGFFIASKEKALCDKIAPVKEISGPEDISGYLEQNLRIDVEKLLLDFPCLMGIERAYGKKSVTAFVKWYENLKGAS